MTSGSVGNRTVAFLDILGFRAKLRLKGTAALAESYEAANRNLDGINRKIIADENCLFPQHPIGRPWCTKFIFSDSIILISEDDSIESALKLLIFTWKVTQVMLCQKLPVRGGISWGAMYANPQTNIFVGDALAAAYDLETRQDWIGVSLDEATTNILDASPMATPFVDDLFKRYDVPFKDGTARAMRTINWRFQLQVESGIGSLFELTKDPKIDQKMLHALEYARVVRESGSVYYSKSPVELAGFASGTKPPPYAPHPDGF